MRSGIFGRDFLSGGLRDYFSRFKEGYWIIGKSEVNESNLGKLLRTAVHETLGSNPIVMPETETSHTVVLLWEGISKETEQGILTKIVTVVHQNDIISLGNKLREEEFADVLKEMENLSKEELPPKIGLPSDLSEDEFEALRRVNRNSRERVYRGAPEPLCDALTIKGYLVKTGRVTKYYELSQRGRVLLGTIKSKSIEWQTERAGEIKERIAHAKDILPYVPKEHAGELRQRIRMLEDDLSKLILREVD